MPVDDKALERIEELFCVEADSVARQYQKGNFRSLKNLVHRAALIAAADRANSIAVSHVDLAIKHGQLQVIELNAMTTDSPIRECFRRSLWEYEVRLSKTFSWPEVKAVTEDHPVPVAAAFLACALLRRHPVDPKHPYHLVRDIERAVVGGVGPNTWVGKALKKEYVREAACQYFQCTQDECPQDATSKAIVDPLRRKGIADEPRNDVRQ